MARRAPGGQASQERPGRGIKIANPGAVAITPTSLVTMSAKVSAMGAIKEVTEVLSVVPLGEADALEVKRMGVTGVMEVTVGGTSFRLEGKAGDMEEVAAAFERAKVAV